MKIENLNKIKQALEKRAAKYSKENNPSVLVGYTQQYAIYVHENLEAFHPVGQAKFLEYPAKLLKEELGHIVQDNLKKGRTISQALLIAGLRLQRESQKLVPVDTGALKGSAFTRLEIGVSNEILHE